MAIDTTNKKLSLLAFLDMTRPSLPLSPGALGTDDQQQLLWGYPGILWSGIIAVIEDMAYFITSHWHRRS